MVLPALYALVTLVTLWALGGGDPTALWPRQLALAVTLWICALSYLATQNRVRDFLKFDRGAFYVGVISAFATALPVIFLIYLINTGMGGGFKIWQESLKYFTPPSFVMVLIVSLLLAPAQEVIWRGIFRAPWGVFNVALLEALNMGFGSQRLGLFLVTGLMGYIWGQIAQQFGVTAALISHSIWALLVLSSLHFLVV